MSTNYPTSKKTFRDVVDNVDDVLALDHNDLGDTVEVLQDEVGYGINDANTSSVQHRLTNHTHNGTSGQGGDISFTDLLDRTFVNLSDSPSTYSGQGLKNVRVNSGETGLEFYNLLIKHYIKGFNLKWVSTTSITIETGVIDIDNTLLIQNTNITGINPQTVGNYIETIGTPPVSTFVYVYLYNNSGAIGYKLSTNAPNKSDSSGNTDGILRYYTPNGTTYYRCIGALILDASSLTYAFTQCNNYVQYNNFFSVSNGSNVSANIPAISRTGQFELYAHGSSGVYTTSIQPYGGTDSIKAIVRNTDGSVMTLASYNTVICNTDANQKLTTSIPTNGTIKTIGYWMNIRD